VVKPKCLLEIQEKNLGLSYVKNVEKNRANGGTETVQCRNGIKCKWNWAESGNEKTRRRKYDLRKRYLGIVKRLNLKGGE